MFSLRTAKFSDVDALQALIVHAGIALSVGYYTPEQAHAITQHVFGVDTQLLRDGSYFVIEEGGVIVACGGWSKRRTLFGGDQTKRGEDPLLDPASEPARIRAFFVDPAMARRGLGRMLMERCISEAILAGFHAFELVSTLPGEPLYLSHGFAIVERFELSLPGDVMVPVSRMARKLS